MSSPVRRLDRRANLSPFRPENRWSTTTTGIDLSPYKVKEYLARFPVVLENYLLETATIDFIESILNRKRSSQNGPTNSIHRKKSTRKCTTPYSEIGIDEVTRRIIECTTDEEICAKIYEICNVLTFTVDADSFNLYVIDTNDMDMSLYLPEDGNTLKHVGPVGARLTVSAHVAVEKKSVNAPDLPQDARFPKGTGLGDDSVHHVMCLPILLETGRCYAVVEFVRGWDRDAFSSSEFELTNAILSWITACVQKMKRNKLLRIQSTLNNYLLETTKVMFDDMDNIDMLVTNIMTFTKDLVSADRSTLFLVDEEKDELFADYFDEGKKAEDGSQLYSKGAQIRFPRDKGIAGYVAKTGEIVNIRDAYEDDRFNPEVDKKTGYHTKNILCMPIHGKHGVIGVVQMINRLDGEYFTGDDEMAFKLFAVYCALALHYSRVYNVLAHQKTKFTVAMDLLEYHLVCAEEDVEALHADHRVPEDSIPRDFHTFKFCCYDYDPILPQLFIRMIEDTFGDKQFDLQTLCRFALTVRKSYRPIAYHNWQHGFHVAHALWMMVRSSRVREFTRLEKMSFIIGGICHDIDHRGYNNDFFKKMHLPLAGLYSSSTMEQHHYRQTVTILHAEGHDIFSFLTPAEHSHMLELIRKNIIATDLALYFENQKYVSGLLSKDQFNAELPEHRVSMMALMMTGADLCAVPKPWETQKQTVEYLYDEFYMQGDEEKAAGITPIPMMDRVNEDDIPKQQIGFINFICKPLYSTLTKILPEAQPLLDGCTECKEHWEMVITENEAKKSTLALRISNHK